MSLLSPILAPRVRLDFAVENGPAHLRCIYAAVRDCGVSFATISQNSGRFAFPAGKPVVALLGDDMHEALGPAAFHRKSVRRFVATCAAAVVIACDAQPRFYAMATSVAVCLRRDVLIVETRSEHEADWIDLVKTISPDIRMLIGTVRPPTGARH